MAKFFDAVLRLSTEQFIKPLEKAGEHLNSFEKQYRDTGRSFWNSGKSMIAAGESISKSVTLPLGAVVGASVKAFGDAEQAIGGIETLFKDSSDEVIKNSETAFKRAGISATKYMEQTTSFSATLLQGLEGDTKAAAKYADMAMVDMSDNANKFGTDIEQIQNAYQGFAKDNFTMLDNLKLGYGGNQAEMARLINDSGVLNGEMEATAENVKDIPYHVMIDAINQIQKDLEVTGTTAQEAEETISGSFGMMKASFNDLLAGLGSKDANIDQLVDNLLYSVKTFGGNLKVVLKTIWDNLPIPDWAKMFVGGLAAAGPLLLVFGKVNKGIGKIFFKLTDLSKAIKNAGGVMKLLATPGIKFVLVAGLIVAAVILIIKYWDTIKAKAEEIFPGITERVSNMAGNVSNFIGTLVQRTIEFLNNLKAQWAIVWESLGPIVEVVVTMITGVIDNLITVLDGVIEFITGIFTGNWEKAWQGVVKIFEGVFGGIKEIGKGIINGMVQIINNGIQGLNRLKVPDWIPIVGGKGIDIPLIPQLAKGTENWLGGVAQVHEKGGEIIDLPRGSRVMPHDKSISEAFKMGRDNSQKQGDTIINIPKLADSVTFKEEADMDVFLDKLYKKLEFAKYNSIGGNV